MLEESSDRQLNQEESLISMSLMDHLEALRWMFLKCIIWILLFYPISYYFTPSLIDYCISLTKVGVLYSHGVAENWLQPFKVAFYITVFFTIPFSLFQIWSFVAPGLYKQEENWFRFALGVSCILFFLGALFGLFVIFPIALDFLSNSSIEHVKVQMRLQYVLAFSMQISAAMGIISQLPVVVSLLYILGVMPLESIKKARSYFYVGIFLVAAFVTPPDVVSQFLLAIPTIILYEMSIIFCIFVEKQKKGKINNNSQSKFFTAMSILALIIFLIIGGFAIKFIAEKVDQYNKNKKLEKKETVSKLILSLKKDQFNSDNKTLKKLLKIWKEKGLKEEQKKLYIKKAIHLGIIIKKTKLGQDFPHIDISVSQTLPILMNLEFQWGIKVDGREYFWPILSNTYRIFPYREGDILEGRLIRENILKNMPITRKYLETHKNFKIEFFLKAIKASDIDGEPILWLNKLTSPRIEVKNNN